MLVKKLAIGRALLLMIVLFAAPASCYTLAGRTPGDMADDSAITAEVKARLFDTSELKGYTIAVDTFQRVVTLTGTVSTEYRRQLAGRIAGAVPDVRRVDNRLVNE